MISEQKFNEIYEEFKNILGKEEQNKYKNGFINGFKMVKAFIYTLDDCKAVEEADKLFDKFKKDDDLYNLLKSIPSIYIFLNIPNDYYIKLYYKKMKEEIEERREKNELL